MNVADIKSLLLKSFIGFLILTAVIAIVTVIGGEIGDLQARILGTTFTISIASICAMSCAAFLEKRNFKPAGITGIVFSLLSAILIITEIWWEVGTDLYFDITIAVVVSAFSFAHSLLLYLPDLADDKRWIQAVTAATISILAVQIILGVWFEIDHELYFRTMTVIAILVGLQTLVIPILMKLNKKSEDAGKFLQLEKIDDHTYKGADGTIYDVREKSS